MSTFTLPSFPRTRHSRGGAALIGGEEVSGWHHKGAQVTAELTWPQVPPAPLPTLGGETHPCHSCPGGPSGQDLRAASPTLLISAVHFLGGLPCFPRLRLPVPWTFLCDWSVVDLQHPVSFPYTARYFSYMFESVSRSVVSNSLPLQPARLFCSWDSPGKDTGVGCLPFPSPGDLPAPGIKPGSPALQADSWLSEPVGKPSYLYTRVYCFSN